MSEITTETKELLRKIAAPRFSRVRSAVAPSSGLALILEIAARFERLEANRQAAAQQFNELSARIERWEADHAHFERLTPRPPFPGGADCLTPPEGQYLRLNLDLL